MSVIINSRSSFLYYYDNIYSSSYLIAVAIAVAVAIRIHHDDDGGTSAASGHPQEILSQLNRH